MSYKIAYKQDGVHRSFRRTSFYDAVCEKNKLLHQGFHNITITEVGEHIYKPPKIEQPKAQRRVKCIETDELFDNAKIAAEKKGCSDKTILKVLLKKPSYKTAGGFHWEYVYVC